MRQYVLRRLALAVPTLVLVSVIVFSIMRLMPGDVVIRMVEGHAYAPTVEALRKELGLDRPAHTQYLEWIGGIVLRGDFGSSYWTRQPIWDEFIRRFPITLELAGLTILTSVVIGVLVGIVSAVRQDTASDYVGRILAILALSVPYFGLAVLVPVVSLIGLQTPLYIGGSVIIEAIFRLPGIGLFFFEALTRLDYPVVQSVNLIVAAMVVGLNLAIDLSYAFLDPRIRYR